MIRKGDRVFIKPEWQDAGDQDCIFIATTDMEKGGVYVVHDNSTMNIKPTFFLHEDHIEVV